jgi:hypothetical protein
MLRSFRLLAVSALLLAVAAPLAAQNPRPATPAAAPAAATPEIYFRAPADGATVPTTFPVAFGLRNYGVAPATVNLANTGHFHILINVDAPAPGQLIPADSLHRHYGAGQIETTLTLAPGTYTLRVVLGDFEHKVISPALVSRPIRITVAAPR